MNYCLKNLHFSFGCIIFALYLINHQMRLSKLLFLIFSPLLIAVLSSCSIKNKPQSYIKKIGMIWNTTYHITYQGSTQLADSIPGILAEVGHSLSVFEQNSLISQINRNENTSADYHLCQVFPVAKRIHRESYGAFDPTLAPAITAWGFGKGHKPTQDTARLDSLAQFIGFDKIDLLPNGKIQKLDTRLQLNLSAIAKGYGCDAVAKMFQRNGVKNYMIEIGGEVAVGGHSSHGKAWTIAIEKPIYSDNEVLPQIAKINITDAGLATSGNYRNFSTASDGSHLGHTISPTTLRPAATDVLSATVIAPTCMEADAYATACMAMGSSKAIQMADSLSLPVMLILPNWKIWMSENMKKYISQ